MQNNKSLTALHRKMQALLDEKEAAHRSELRDGKPEKPNKADPKDDETR